MRFLLNTHRDDAGTRVCIRDLHARLRALGHVATLNDWGGCSRHDVVVFMGYDHDITRTRRDNPHIRIVLADPKLGSEECIDAARQADLLLVSSVEQRDAFLRLNQNIFIYYMFPKTERRIRRHVDGKRLVVAYHGNRVHLDAMRHTVAPALVALARLCPVELLCIYNVADLGCADLSYLERGGITVTHRQWDAATLVDTLITADIGIMPNELPIRDRQSTLLLTAYPEGDFAYEPFDHLVRYKASTNPGRLHPFACAGLPVIADFCPSAAQFICDGESGFLASSPHGWYFALSRLAESAALRQVCAERLFDVVTAQYERQAGDFVHACQDLVTRTVPEIAEAASAEAEQRLFNEYPRPQETLLRWLLRQARRLGSPY